MPPAWDSFWPNTVSGLVGGLAVVIIGGLIAYGTTSRWERRRGAFATQRARRLSTVEELYGAYGDFFAVWKAWEYFTASGKPGSDHSEALADSRVADFAARAAVVEARLERFLVQVTLEQPLEPEDEAALWALRFAMRKLRLKIRQRLPLEWWRPAAGEDDRETELPFREYRAYKGLVTLAAQIASRTPTATALPRPGHLVLTSVTGSGIDYINGLVHDVAGAEAGLGLPDGVLPDSGWQWLPVAEALLKGS